jgi:hypothetical protein
MLGTISFRKKTRTKLLKCLYPNNSLYSKYSHVKVISGTIMWDFKFSRRRLWSSESSGMYCRVLNWMSTDVSVVRAIILHGSISQKTTLNIKQSRYTPWKLLEGEEYSSYSFTTSALDGSEWSASRPSRALSPEKWPPLPTGQEAARASEPVWIEARGKIHFQRFVYLYEGFLAIIVIAVPLPPCRRQGEMKYSSYSFWTSALAGDEWSVSRPGRALLPGKGPGYPLDRRLGGTQSWLDTEARGNNPLPLPGIEPNRLIGLLSLAMILGPTKPSASCGEFEFARLLG